MKDFEEVAVQYAPMISALIRKLHIYRDYDTFRQIGNIALWQAWQRFEDSKGNFTPFAYRSIQGAMLDELKRETKRNERGSCTDNGVREKAEETVKKRLKEVAKLKKSKPDLLIGVLGCMAERLKSKFLEDEKLVDIVVGPDAYRDLPRLVNQAYDGDKGINVFLSREETYADIAPLRLESNGITAAAAAARTENPQATGGAAAAGAGGDLPQRRRRRVLRHPR